MEDRVAEILAERRTVESGAAAAVIASIFAHAAITALAMWAAWHQTAPQTPAVMMIKFAKPQPQPVLSTPAPPAPAPAPAPKPVEKIELPKPVAAKPVAKPVEASNFGKSSKKETPPGGQPPPAVTDSGGPLSSTTSTQPEVALEGGDFPYTVYIDRMKALIGSRWFRPQVGTPITATVSFTIDRDGSIREVKVETPSGNGTFDRSALRAVLESSPLPPLPFGYSGTYLGVHLTFR